MHLHRCVAITLALGTALAPAALAGDEKKPKKKDPVPVTVDETGCRDIVSGDGEWDHLGSLSPERVEALPGGVLDFAVVLGQTWSGGPLPDCAGVTYTFVVRDAAGQHVSTRVVQGEHLVPSGSGPLEVRVRDVLPTSSYCVAIDVTATQDGIVHDAAPDAGTRDNHEDLCTFLEDVSPGRTWN